MSADFWAEVFDEDWIRGIPNLFVNGICVLSTFGYFATYTLNGSNLEGMLGKMLTYTMICIMGMCTRLLKKKQIMDKSEKVTLLSFLDDGVGCWIVKKSEYREKVAIITDLVIKLFKIYSFEVKLSKSYPSDRFFVFLNVYFYLQSRLFDHVKTFLKAGIEKGNEILSVPEKIREAGSWASGAVAAGGDWYMTYVRYVWECIQIAHRNDPLKAPQGMLGAIQMYAPVACMGYGMQALTTIVSNVARHPFSEGVSLLRAIGSTNQRTRPVISKVMNLGVKRKSGQGFLRAPTTVTTANVKLRESTLTRKIEQKVKGMNHSVYLRDVLSLNSEEYLEEIGMNLMNQRRSIALVMVEDLFNSQPEKVFEQLMAKFKKSDTVAAMFGGKFANSIVKGYRTDCWKVNNAFLKHVSG